MRPRTSKSQAVAANTPPWRQPLGLAFIRLDSAAPARSNPVKAKHLPKYFALLQSTFSAFSDLPIGSDVPIEDLSVPRRIGFEPEWEVDVVPMRGLGEGDQDILYDATATTSETPNKSTSRQACWNCLEPGHSFTSCPLPRDHLMVRYSRAKFLAEKEAMPNHHRPYLESYAFTEEERERRLELAGRFVPGPISDKLADAVFWINPDLLHDQDGVVLEDGEVWEEESEEVLEIQELRRRRAWPWLLGMSRWGYPPGWIASGDPIGAVKRHIESLPITTENDSDDDDDMLHVFGGIGTFTPTPGPSSPSSTSSASSGSDMALSNDSSSETSISSPQRRSIKVTTEPANGCQHAPPPPDSLPPPPPDDPTPHIPAPPSDPAPPPPRPRFPPPRRWARYDTDMFDSDRLTAYTTARPLPLGS